MAELADDQLVPVDGGVVEHVVPLEVPGVVDEVVVHGVVPHLEVGVRDGGFQVDGLGVPVRWEQGGCRNRHKNYHAGAAPAQIGMKTEAAKFSVFLYNVFERHTTKHGRRSCAQLSGRKGSIKISVSVVFQAQISGSFESAQ